MEDMRGPDGKRYRRIHALADAHVAQLMALYRNEWWAHDRTLEDVRRMLAHSDVVFGFEDAETGEFAAFARVLTDFTYKALIFDVIVRPDSRGAGLGKRLMDEICRDPRLASVKHFELYCKPELKPFYEHWGFTADLGDLTFMRRSPVGD